jgi:hypothetical protein
MNIENHPSPNQSGRKSWSKYQNSQSQSRLPGDDCKCFIWPERKRFLSAHNTPEKRQCGEMTVWLRAVPPDSCEIEVLFRSTLARKRQVSHAETTDSQRTKYEAFHTCGPLLSEVPSRRILQHRSNSHFPTRGHLLKRNCSYVI